MRKIVLIFVDNFLIYKTWKNYLGRILILIREFIKVVEY